MIRTISSTYVIFALFLLMLLGGAVRADDPNCVRHDCLGICVDKDHDDPLNSVLKICTADYQCFARAKCARLSNSQCGWVYPPDMAPCFTEMRRRHNT
jgi:hypothetical protein